MGKSTFCQYVAYQYAAKDLWKQFDLIILLPMVEWAASERGLFSFLKQYYSLSGNPEEALKKENANILWVIDGYENVVDSLSHHTQLAAGLNWLFAECHYLITVRDRVSTQTSSLSLNLSEFDEAHVIAFVKRYFS